MDEEDPQLALSRPASLVISQPAGSQEQQAAVSAAARTSPTEPQSGDRPVGITQLDSPSMAGPVGIAQLGSPSMARPAAAPPLDSPSTARQVTVADLTASSDTDRASIMPDNGYVNKVVRSLAALRSVVVSRRQPPVLNERSYR
jgi:hypothetical protein